MSAISAIISASELAGSHDGLASSVESDSGEELRGRGIGKAVMSCCWKPKGPSAMLIGRGGSSCCCPSQ